MARRSSIIGCAVGLMWLATGAHGAAVSGARTVTVPGQVRAFERGELVTRAVEDAPPATDLREMRVEPRDDGGYLATLTFAGRWKRFSTFRGARSTHQVFVSMQPPDGARMRVHLNSEGRATLDRVDGDRFARVDDAVVRTDGASLVFEIVPSVGMTANWEVQGHSLVRDARGGGVHAHTAQVRVGSLTGEDGRAPRLAAGGTRLDARGVPILWEPREPMPAGSRPTSFRIVRRTGGLAIEVTMDAPLARVSVDGKRAAGQFVGVVLGVPGSGDEYTLLYDVIGEVAAGAPAGGDAGILPGGTIEADGDVLRFNVTERTTAAGRAGSLVPVGRVVPHAQSTPPTDTPTTGGDTPTDTPTSDAPTDAPPQTPPPPAVGPETDVSVVAIAVTEDGGVAIESPTIPAGELIPPAGGAGGGGIGVAPVIGGVIVALIVIIVIVRIRGGADCTDLERTVDRLRGELKAISDRVAIHEGVARDVGEKVKTGAGQDDAEREANLQRLRENADRLRDAREREEQTGRELADAETALARCRGASAVTPVSSTGTPPSTPSPAGDPSPAQPADEGDPKDKDPCEELQREYESARRELERAEKRFEDAERAHSEAMSEVWDETLGAASDIAKAARAELGEDAVAPTPEQRDAASEHLKEASKATDEPWNERGEAYWSRDSARHRLKEAERKLKECRERTGTTSPEPSSEPSVLSQIDEVPVIS